MLVRPIATRGRRVNTQRVNDVGAADVAEMKDGLGAVIHGKLNGAPSNRGAAV